MAQATAEREGCFVFGWSKDGLATAWFLAPLPPTAGGGERGGRVRLMGVGRGPWG